MDMDKKKTWPLNVFKKGKRVAGLNYFKWDLKILQYAIQEPFNGILYTQKSPCLYGIWGAGSSEHSTGLT